MTLQDKITKFKAMAAKVKNGKKMTKKEVYEEKRKKFMKMWVDYNLK